MYMSSYIDIYIYTHMYVCDLSLYVYRSCIIHFSYDMLYLLFYAVYMPFHLVVAVEDGEICLLVPQQV